MIPPHDNLEKKIIHCLDMLLAEEDFQVDDIFSGMENSKELTDKLHQLKATMKAQKIREEHFQQTLERSEYILEGAGLGSWDWYLESNQVIFDRLWCEMLGLKYEQTPQFLSTWETRVHPEDLQKTYADIKSYLDGKTQVYENIHRVKHVQGHWVWILDRGRISQYDKNGKPIRFTGTHFDITNYKEYEQISNVIQRKAKIGGWELDVQTGASRWTSETYRIHALPENLTTSREMSINFYAEHERARISEKVQECMAGKSYSEIFQFIDANGNHKWVEAMGEPMFNAEGKVYKLIGSFQDITDKKIALDKANDLAEQNKIISDQMSAILNHAPIASYECLHDQHWTTNYMGSFIKKITGYPASDFIRNEIRSYESIIHPEDSLHVRNAVESAINSKSSFEIKYRIIHADGSIRWLSDKGNISEKTGHLVGVVFDISEQESHMRDLNNIFDQSIDLLCIANHKGYFTRVSPSFISLLGYSEEELLSQPYVNFVQQEDFEKTNEETKNLFEGRASYIFENRYKCKNGELKILSWVSKVDLKTNLVYASARDVTLQRNQDHKNKQILDVVNQAWIVSETDSKGIIRTINENFKNTSLYSNDEIIGQDHRVLNSGSHSKQFFREMWSDLQSGKTWQGLIKNRRKDGEYYYVKSVMAPVRDLVTGKIESFFSIRQDVSEEIKNQLILEEAENIGQIGSFKLNLQKNIFSSSKGFLRIMETSADSDLGFHSLLQKVHPEDLNIIHEAFHSLTHSRTEEFRIRYRIVLQQDRIKFIESHGRVQRDQHHSPELVLGMIQDVTKGVLLQEQLEQQHVQLMQSAKLASLGEMSAGIAHEINNPLAIILGNIQLLSKFKNDEGNFTAKVDTISRSVARIEKIVKGLKKFSRSSSGLIRKLHSLDEIVNESLMLTQIKANLDSVLISADVQKDLFILCDSVEIEQVIINLINNSIDAIKHLKEKWIKVVGYSHQNTIVLQIIDSGFGMPLEVEQKIFQPFFTTKSVGEGTGLGLSITKGILDHHEAKIFINKKLQNTCFEIHFENGRAQERKSKYVA